MTTLFTLVALAVFGTQAVPQPRSAPADGPTARSQPAGIGSGARADAAGDGFLAVLVPRRSIVLGAPREGTLATVDAALGRTVQAGTVLATLETAPLERDLLAARLALREAEGELRKAEVYLAKSQELCERIAARVGAFTEAERRDAEFNQRVAVEEQRIVTIRIEQRQLDIRRLEQLIQNSQVVAPIDGAIATRYLDAGATLAHATPILRVISNDLVVRFAVPADRREPLLPGTRVRFTGSTGAIVLEATVENVARELDPALQMIVVEATPGPATSSEPRPGAEGRVSVVPTAHSSAATAPASSAAQSDRTDSAPK